MTNNKLLRILIADDNQASRKGLRALLNALNRTQTQNRKIEIVGDAENGQQAVVLAEELMPDLIFMDIEMPYLDGLDAAKIIKKKIQDIKIVILSMHSDQRKTALEMGADDFIVKGTDSRIIKQVILRMFNQQS